MTAFGDDPKTHHVIGDAEGGLTFVCSAPPDAECRTHPTCDCEVWCCCATPGAEHDAGEHCCSTTNKPGRPCWMSGWIDVDVEGSGPTMWSGPDYQDPRVGRHAVTVDWDDGCTWDYADPAPLAAAVAVAVEPDPIATRHRQPGPNDLELPL